MGRISTILRCILLCGMLCLPLTGRGQEVRTKSGTPVVAVPREPACFPAPKAAAAPDPGVFLVLSPPEWRATLEPLLRWKRRQGFRVEWMAAEVRQRDTLRARLMTRYREASPLRPPQRYVLLVGDVDRIQSFVGRHTPSGLNNSVTDLYYGEYTGDYVPEALVGRLSVADSQQLALVVRKIVNYGKFPSLDMGNRCLLVAGSELSDPAPVTTHGQVDYLSRLALRHSPLLQPCVHRHNDTAAASLAALLHSPYNLVNYTGHGIRGGWNNPVLTAAMADTLTGFSPALMVNNCCLTNAFDATCFGEQMLRGGRGTVGVIGATNETLWNEDYFWAVGAKYPPVVSPALTGVPGAFDTVMSYCADALQPGAPEALTLGRMLYNGCRAVSLSGSAYDAFYWETYCLLGDPSMIPLLGFPSHQTSPVVTAPVEAGVSRLELRAMPFARVSVTDDSSLLGTALADSAGVARIPLCRSLTPDSVRLTVLRPQYYPEELLLTPAVPAGARLAVTAWRVVDTLLRVRLSNVGNQSAAHPRLSLTINGVGDSLSLPLIPAGGTFDTCFPLTSGAWLLPPFVEALLSACADTACTFLSIAFEAPLACPDIAALALLTSDSLPAALLLPGEEYTLAVTLSQPADSLVAEINGRRSVAVGIPSASFPLTLDGDSRAEVRLVVSSSCGIREDHFWLQGFRAVETFEDAALGAYPWHSPPPYPWRIDSVASRGRQALRSAPLPDGMKSVLSISLDVLQPDSVTFLYNVSSEASDWLYFYVDGRRQGWWSGSTGWRRYAWPLAKGKHLLEWHYAKDGSISQRDDCARLDHISFPLCRWDAPYGTPMPDTSLAVPRRMASDAPLSAHPNPVADWLTVLFPGSVQVAVVNAVGQCVDRFSVTGTARYSVRHLPAGVYWLVARSDSLLRQKVIVVK